MTPQKPSPEPMVKDDTQKELALARAELARLQTDYEALVDNAPDVLARHDRQGRLLSINKTIERNSGIPVSAFLGKTIREMSRLPEPHVGLWEQAIESVFVTGEPTRVEYEFPIPGRGVCFFESLLTPDRGPDGTVASVVSVTRDLTERRKAEIALRHSEERYRSLVDATSQLVWTNSAEGEMRGPNPDWGRFTGQSEAEYQGYGWAAAVHPDDAQPTIDAWNASVTARTPFVFEHRLRRRDGDYRLFAIRATPVLDESGTIREWVGIHTDITERRQAIDALRESEARKAAILEAALDCIITIDDGGQVIEWNPAAERTFGYPRDAAMGKFLTDLIIPPTLREAHTRGLTHCRATGEGPVLNNRIEVPARRADGTEFPAELTVIPIYLEGRTLFTATVRDLTERDRTAAQQRAFLRDVLLSVTEGKLHLCYTPDDLPTPLPQRGEPVDLAVTGGLRQLRHQTQEVAVAQGFSQDRWYDLVTAASEAAMNAVVHAGGGQGRVCGAQDVVQVWVEDQGRGIDVAHLPRATLEKGYTTAGTLGHGMKMMLSTADRVWLLTGASGTRVVMEQDRLASLPEWQRTQEALLAS